MKRLLLAALLPAFCVLSSSAQAPSSGQIRSVDQHAIREILVSRVSADVRFLVADQDNYLDHLTFAAVSLGRHQVVYVRPSASPEAIGFWLFDVSRHGHPVLLCSPVDGEGGTWSDTVKPPSDAGYYDFLLNDPVSGREIALHFDGLRYRVIPSTLMASAEVVTPRYNAPEPSQTMASAALMPSTVHLTLASMTTPR